MKTKFIALIPARSGSKRVPNKNIALLGQHPLIAYTIQSAIQSNVFSKILVITDSMEYKKIAEYYGAEVPKLRPIDISTDFSPDIDWVKWALSLLTETYDGYSILRPTSPFRLPSTIINAYNFFLDNQPADSLRAVQKVKEHPGKMWIVNSNRMHPILPFKTEANVPWHSSQLASLPEIYIQNASLEIAWIKSTVHNDSISGENIIPFFTNNLEGFDINTNEDFLLANHHLKNDVLDVTNIIKKPFKI